MKYEDYGFPLEYNTSEEPGVEGITKYLIGGALAAGGGYGVYKAYNYLKKKNEEKSNSKSNDKKSETKVEVPEWFMSRSFITKLINEKFPKDKDDAFFELKNELENYISMCHGNKELILKHIKWLEDHGYFHWEEDDNLGKNVKFKDKIEEYYFKKGGLVQNFSKERFDQVIELYKIYKEKNNL